MEFWDVVFDYISIIMVFETNKGSGIPVNLSYENIFYFILFK